MIGDRESAKAQIRAEREAQGHAALLADLQSVRTDLEARLTVDYGDVVRLDLSLRYEASDPYAVKAVFSADGTETEWVFARDLLAGGLERATGDGDVRIWPVWNRKAVMASLTSPHGSATIELDAKHVVSFLNQTNAVVVPGREVQDMDPMIARILAGAK